MNLRKPAILFSVVFLLLIVALPLAMAATMDPFSMLGELFNSLLNVVIDIFKFTGLALDSQDGQEPLMRFMVWVISFALAQFALRQVFSKATSNSGASGGERLPTVIAICLATITAVFTPWSVLQAIGIQYSAFVQAILLAAILGAVLYVAYGMIKKPQGWIGHAARLGLLLFAWFLLSGFMLATAVDDVSFGDSFSFDFDMGDAVLGYMWSVMSMVLGIMIFYEIVMIFISAGKGSVGNLGSHLSNAAGWVNNNKKGWGDLTNAFKREENDDKDIDKAIVQEEALERQEANFTGIALQKGKNIRDALTSLLQGIETFSSELSNYRQVAQSMDPKKKQAAIDKISDIKKETIKNLGPIMAGENARISRIMLAYQGVDKELKIEQFQEGKSKFEELEHEIRNIVQNATQSGTNPEKLKQLQELSGAFLKMKSEYTNKFREFEDLNLKKQGYLGRAVKYLQYTEANEFKNLVTDMNGADWTDPSVLTRFKSRIENLIKLVTQDEEMLSIAETIERDINKHLEDLKASRGQMKRMYNALIDKAKEFQKGSDSELKNIKEIKKLRGK